MVLKAIGKGLLKAVKIVSGYEAIQDRKLAKNTMLEADEIIASVKLEDERRRNECNEILKQFGEQRLFALQECLSPFLAYIEILGNKYKDREYEILSQIDLPKEEIKKLETVEMNTSTAFGMVGTAGVMATAALSGVPSATTWAVGMLASASTGTAISSLSGAAATNATLAWLGGGSLAAGGGGMAAGAATLSAITATAAGVFALASAGIIGAAYFSKKYTKATEYLEQAKEFRSKAELGWEAVTAINKRAKELESITVELKKRINEELIYLEPLIYDFQTNEDYNIATFQQSAILVKSLSEISQVPIIDAAGSVSEESGIAITNTQRILNRAL